MFSDTAAGANPSANLYSLVEDYEALLPQNVKTELASFTARPVERQNAVA